MMMSLDVNCNLFSPEVLVDSSVFEFGHTHCCKLGCHRKKKKKKKKKRNCIVDSDESAPYDHDFSLSLKNERLGPFVAMMSPKPSS